MTAPLSVGTELPPLPIEPISRKTLALFAGASGDHQPTHLDIEAARAKGRQDVIAHGMLVMAYLSRVLTDLVPQAQVRSYRSRFIAITPVNAQPTCTGRVVARDGDLATLELAVHLADGTAVLKGEAVVDLRPAAVPARPAAAPTERPAPLVLRAQGSFTVGGTVIRNPGRYDPTQPGPAGQTLHGDHAFVSWQIPVDARPLPIAFLHGNQQFAKTWQTTPDGREGFQNLFLRRGFGVYLMDQPRRGGAGRSTLPMMMEPALEDQIWFDRFRVGVWPDYFPGVQFPRGEAVLDQYFRQITPSTGPFDLDVAANATVALFQRIGPGILVTHSQGGGIGWHAAVKGADLRAIASYEPGSNFPFPEGEVPEPRHSADGPLPAMGVPLQDFLRLTRIPIVIYYGDYIPTQPSTHVGQDQWRVRVEMARLWVDAVNRHGGDASLVCLPDIGIHGNTHFPFSDLNNVQVADELSRFLQSRRLD